MPSPQRQQIEWRGNESYPLRAEVVDYLEEQLARKAYAEARRAEAEADAAEADARFVEAEAERLELKVFRQSVLLVLALLVFVLVVVELVSSSFAGEPGLRLVLLR